MANFGITFLYAGIVINQTNRYCIHGSSVIAFSESDQCSVHCLLPKPVCTNKQSGFKTYNLLCLWNLWADCFGHITFPKMFLDCWVSHWSNVLSTFQGVHAHKTQVLCALAWFPDLLSPPTQFSQDLQLQILVCVAMSKPVGRWQCSGRLLKLLLEAETELQHSFSFRL